MGREDRHFVHELAGHYGLTSEAQDPEPNRSVVVFRNAMTEAFIQLPSPLLSEVVGLAAAVDAGTQAAAAAADASVGAAV